MVEANHASLQNLRPEAEPNDLQLKGSVTSSPRSFARAQDDGSWRACPSRFNARELATARLFSTHALFPPAEQSPADGGGAEVDLADSVSNRAKLVARLAQQVFQARPHAVGQLASLLQIGQSQQGTQSDGGLQIRVLARVHRRVRQAAQVFL